MEIIGNTILGETGASERVERIPSVYVDDISTSNFNDLVTKGEIIHEPGGNLSGSNIQTSGRGTIRIRRTSSGSNGTRTQSVVFNKNILNYNKITISGYMAPINFPPTSNNEGNSDGRLELINENSSVIATPFFMSLYRFNFGTGGGSGNGNRGVFTLTLQRISSTHYRYSFARIRAEWANETDTGNGSNTTQQNVSEGALLDVSSYKSLMFRIRSRKGHSRFLYGADIVVDGVIYEK